MTYKQSEYERLARYLAGESSDDELAAIESRIKEDSKYAAMVTRLKKVWNAKTPSTDYFDEVSAWKQFVNKIDNVENHLKVLDKQILHKQPSRLNKSKNKSNSVRMKMNWVMHIAALFVVAGLTVLFTFLYMEDSAIDDQIALQNVSTEKGQRSNILLNDGSRIILNSDSKITYPLEFDNEFREVHMEGEAYFTIAEDDKPFYVYAGESVIKILGTEFNVRSYEEEDIEVVVSSGLVAVRYTDTTDEEAIYLEKGDKARLFRDGFEEPIVTHNVVLERYIGWLDYNFIFEDTSMNEIVKVLERTYGIDIEFADTELPEMRLSANFKGDSMHDILQVMEYVLDIEYKIDDRRILLSRSTN